MNKSSSKQINIQKKNTSLLYPKKITDRVPEQTKQFLGEHNTDRLYLMLDTEAGWDFGKGEQLKYYSLKALNWFANSVPLNTDSFSLFMSNEGHLVLEGYQPTTEKNVIEITFKDRIIEMWFEDSDFITTFEIPK